MSANRQFDHAMCPQGHLTPIQPSTPESIEDYRISIETGTAPLFVACRECTHVYKVRSLHSLPSTCEFQPVHVDAPLRRFQISIPCETLRCESHAIVIALRSSDTSAEAVLKEIRGRRLDEVECLDRHKYPSQPWL